MRSNSLLGIGAAVVLALTFGCAANPQAVDDGLAGYRRALRHTASRSCPGPPQGSPEAAAVLDNFIALYSRFEKRNIHKYVRLVYATDAYYRDGFKEIVGVDGIEAYLLRGASIVEENHLEICAIICHGHDYYVQWVSHYKLNRDASPPRVMLGISHLRMNCGGRIIFQNDYWETGRIYEQLPIVGYFLGWLKHRL
jgi:hypothetical protein